MPGDGAAHGEATSVLPQLCLWKEKDGVLDDDSSGLGEGQMMKGSNKSTKRKVDVAVTPRSERMCASQK